MIASIWEFHLNPAAKKMNSTRAAEPRVWNWFFFSEGWGWNSPIPPSHPHAINIVIERKMKHWYLNSLQKDGIEQCHLFQKGGIGQCHLFQKDGIQWCHLFQKDGINQCHLFERKVTFLHLWKCRDQGIPGYMYISVLFFKLLQWRVFSLVWYIRHWWWSLMKRDYFV